MSRASLIEFLQKKLSEIEAYEMTQQNVQAIVDFGLDTLIRCKAIGVEPGENFMISINLFQNLLEEEFKGDDDKFFHESKEDVMMDLSLLISRLQR